MCRNGWSTLATRSKRVNCSPRSAPPSSTKSSRSAEVVSAEATVTQAKANRDYSHTNLERYQLLAPTGVASQQELEQKRAQAAVDVANVDVAIAAVGGKQANIRRLLQLKGFAKVVAPYAGTITSRTIERGALVTAATGMFKIAIVDPVRVFVDVPQDVAPSVRANTAAKVTVAEYPGRVFEGAVTRTAGALAPASRTLKTEVRVPNHGGELLTGMYAEVELSLPSPHRAYELPATAVMTDAHGVRVAVVTAITTCVWCPSSSSATPAPPFGCRPVSTSMTRW